MTGYESKRAAAQDKLAQPAQEHCQCPACKDGNLHWSDCVVHDETPLAAELCNCGVVNPRIVTQQQDTPSEAFFDWWGSDYDDSSNPFRKGAMAYWAFAGWQAALAQPEQELTLQEQLDKAHAAWDQTKADQRKAYEFWIKTEEVRDKAEAEIKRIETLMEQTHD